MSTCLKSKDYNRFLQVYTVVELFYEEYDQNGIIGLIRNNLSKTDN